ncbi:MAG TPA: hypothetical protein DCK99_22025 [Blastocatellia bacterium]|jgi:hypothetical protein|nr:hypothetical protein [Blastocatellia bacterium]
MTVYCGVDFHARKQTISYLTTEAGEIQQKELPHEHRDIRGFYAQLLSQGHVVVGFESSGYEAWLQCALLAHQRKTFEYTDGKIIHDIYAFLAFSTVRLASWRVISGRVQSRHIGMRIVSAWSLES